MVKSLKDKNNSSSAISLTNLLTGQSSTPENIPALQYGHEMEEEARQHYLEEMKHLGYKDVKVEPCGLFAMQNKSFIGASPDAVVSCGCCGKGVLEIKCPYSIANQIPSESNLTYLGKGAVNGKVNLVSSHPYYSQVQTQMGVTGRRWCDFLAYTRHGIHLERIMFDRQRWLQILYAAECFFINHMAPVLVHSNTSGS